MFHFYFGEDDFRIYEEYRSLRDSLTEHESLDTNNVVLTARGLSPQELIQHVAAAPFLGEARLVAVDGLLTSLGRGQETLHEWQSVLDVILELPSTNHLALLEPLQTRDRRLSLERSALAKALRTIDNADIREFRELRTYGRRGEPSEVMQWVLEHAHKREVNIEQTAVQELVDLVGANLWSLSSEIDKLGQYANNRAVTTNDVRTLTPESTNDGIFDLVDAVVEGRPDAALILLRKMLNQGTDTPPNIQSMLARQFRHLVRATELLQQGAAEQSISEATGVRSRFPLGKLMRQARSTTMDSAESALREIESSDHSVKTGRLAADVALELLLTRLATISRLSN